jgi:hypothetical protein
MQKHLEEALQSEAWMIFIYGGYRGDLIVLTFVIAAEIHGNFRTKVSRANPHDQVSLNSSKDRRE